jgi:hypothetical protein
LKEQKTPTDFAENSPKTLAFSDEELTEMNIL